jgi:hypothetical protein
MHKRSHRPDQWQYVSSRRKFALTKQYLQQGHCHAHQLRPDLEFSACKFRHWTPSLLSPALANSAAPSHESPSQDLYTSRTQVFIASPQFSASMLFFMSDFIMEQRHVPWWQHTAELRNALSRTKQSRKTRLRVTETPSSPANTSRPFEIHQQSLPKLDIPSKINDDRR